MPLVSFEAKLTYTRVLSEDIRIYRFAPADGKELPFAFQPGQFLQIEVKSETGELVRRAFSIASTPAQTNEVEFFIRVFQGGACTPRIDAAKVGDTLTLRGPFGKFVLEPSGKPKGFIAAGTGIAPIASMIRDMEARGETTPATLLYGTRFHRQRVYHDEFLTWAEKPGRTYLSLFSGDEPLQEGERAGRVTEALEIFTDPVNTEFYVCGPPAMVTDVRTQLRERGATDIRIEAYD